MKAAAPTLDDLLQRYLALTEIALRAVQAGDGTALAGALDARALATRALGEFTRSGAARQPLPAATRRLVDEATQRNGELEARVLTARDDIRRQLERIAHDESAVAAYAGSAPRTARVDVRR